ncbi:hypothetical protein D3C79_747040 [compost metagenome]
MVVVWRRPRRQGLWLAGCRCGSRPDGVRRAVVRRHPVAGDPAGARHPQRQVLPCQLFQAFRRVRQPGHLRRLPVLRGELPEHERVHRSPAWQPAPEPEQGAVHRNLEQTVSRFGAERVLELQPPDLLEQPDKRPLQPVVVALFRCRWLEEPQPVADRVPEQGERHLR